MHRSSNPMFTLWNLPAINTNGIGTFLISLYIISNMYCCIGFHANLIYNMGNIRKVELLSPLASTTRHANEFFFLKGTCKQILHTFSVIQYPNTPWENLIFPNSAELNRYHRDGMGTKNLRLTLQKTFKSHANHYACECWRYKQWSYPSLKA